MSRVIHPPGQLVTDYTEADIFALPLCIGSGLYFSLIEKPDEKYKTISLAQIAMRLNQPANKAKNLMDWILPSGYNGYDARGKPAQALHPRHILVVDIDTGNHALDSIKVALTGLRVLIFSTKSSTSFDRRWRVLIPLSNPVPFDQWHATMKYVADMLNESGITIDHSLERESQISFLPNRGEHYECADISGNLLQPSAVDLRSEPTPDLFLDLKPKHLQNARVIDLGIGCASGPWQIYNTANPLTDVMARYGYMHVTGNRWHSPLQVSRSNHVYAHDDGTWTSHSGSDAAAGIGKESDKGHRWGTAYDLYVYFEHGNDRKAADAAILALRAASGDDTDPTPRAPCAQEADGVQGDSGAVVAPVICGSRPFGADNHTDLANARRIKNAYGHRLCYCPAVDWMTHSHTWRPDKGKGEQIFHNLGRLIRDEAKRMDEWVNAAEPGEEFKVREKARTGRNAWAMQSESASKINAAISLGRREMAVAADLLDRNPLHVGLKNGVFDLDTGAFHSELPAAYVTHACGVEYRPGATCPRWEAFVLEIMAGNIAMAAYLQRLAGYILTANRSEHLLLILHGGGSNGKSTFVGILQKAMGDYAMSLPSEAICGRDGMTPTQKAALRGKRLGVLAETRDGGRLNEAEVKVLTGADSMTGRALYKEDVTYTPTHQLLVQTNHRPVIRGDDHAIWRRIELIPFAVRFTDQTKDRNLPQKLEAELPGILNWMIAGYQQYKAGGLGSPEAIKKAKGAYRRDEDLFSSWMDDRCDTSKSTATTTLATAYVSFKLWLEDEGIRATMTKRHFRQRFEEAGFTIVKGGHATQLIVHGVSLAR